jgi:DNA-binding NarL/FixJ family response regulator
MTETPAAPPTFLVVDDHALLRDGIALNLRTLYPACQVLAAGSVREATEVLAREPAVDLVLLDLNLGETKGIDSLVQLKDWCEANRLQPRIVVLSAAAEYDEQLIVDAIVHCATGYISKGVSEAGLKRAIDLTLSGGVCMPEGFRAQGEQALLGTGERPSLLELFTPREAEIAELLQLGLSYKEIARQLVRGEQAHVVSDHTVRAHVQRMAWKLRVRAPGFAEAMPAKAAVVTALATLRAAA